MNDKIAAAILARLLAKGLLVGIWVPPVEVRELRALIAQRTKMTRLATQGEKPSAFRPAAPPPNSPGWRSIYCGSAILVAGFAHQ